MTDLLKTDSLLAVMAVVLGLVSTVDEFWQKLILILIAVAIIMLRSILKMRSKK